MRKSSKFIPRKSSTSAAGDNQRGASSSWQRVKHCRVLVILLILLLLVSLSALVFFHDDGEDSHVGNVKIDDPMGVLPRGGHIQKHMDSSNSIRSSTDSHTIDSSSSIFGSIDGSGSSVLHSNVSSLLHLQRVLAGHPLHKLTSEQKSSFEMEDFVEFIHKHASCAGKPVFTTMANVFSDLYWQMIENFIYTMVKFGLSDCSLMVCVSDDKCMQLCKQADFPCFDFRYQRYHPNQPLPSALEQIGELKLLHLPKALARGVDLMMLDLDAGFLDNPAKLLSKLKSSKSDIFVQRDIAFVMNRSVVGWRTWYTVPLPNIGIFLCRGNERTVKMFQIAWRDYKSIKTKIKHNPGKDQNKVVEAMRIARSKYKLRWEYFPSSAAVLLDKIYKFDRNTTYELGGEAALLVLQQKGAFAVHTTCYEQKAKVNGLKAANAFWNPRYYNPQERTLTKPLLLLDERQLRYDLRALLYLAYSTNRSLILANVLGDERSAALSGVELYKQRALWPAFRVAFFKQRFNIPVKLLEPAFYWRIQRDYLDEDHGTFLPPPTVVPLRNMSEFSIGAIEQLLHSEEFRDVPRLVLDAPAKARKHRQSAAAASARLQRWAADSVGFYETFEIEAKRYRSMPLLNDPPLLLSQHQQQQQLQQQQLRIPLRHPQVAHSIVQDVRLCDQVMHPKLGNRSCFDKCD